MDAWATDSAVAGVRKPASLVLLLAGATTVYSGGATLPPAAQIHTVDLSESPIETVIPPEYDGGFFARIGDILVNDRGIWVSDVGHSQCCGSTKVAT